MKTEFELSQKFQPFYKSGKQIYVTSDEFIIADDGENINYINKSNLQKIGNFNEGNEEVTCFVASSYDYVCPTVIIANKNLMLRRIDRFNRDKRHKIWNSNHSAPVSAMCLNRFSSRLVTGGGDNKVRIWHIGEGEGNSYSCVHHKSKINIVKMHPIQAVVVSSSILDHEVASWDTETGKLLGLFVGHQGIVTGIDFHESSNQMATSSRDETVIVWNCKTFAKMFVIPAFESVESCIILEGFMNQPEKDDYLIMVGGNNGIMKTLSPHKKAIVQEFKKASLFENQPTEDLKKDNSGLKTIRLIMKTENSIVIVRESDNIEFYSYNMKLEYELAGHLSDIRDIVMVGKDRNILLAVESTPYMRLFSCKSYFDQITSDAKSESNNKIGQWPCQLISGGHTKDITSVCVFGSNQMVVSGGKDGRVCVWKVEENSKLQLKLMTFLESKDNMVRTLCVDDTGKHIYVNYSVDETLVVLSYKKGSLTKSCSFIKPHANIITCMDISLEGHLLATGSKDKTVKMWAFQKKTKEIACKGVLKGHKKSVRSVQFSKLEQALLTSSMDKTIKLWSVDDLSCLSTFQSEYIIFKALFYEAEKKIISCDEHGLVTVWNREKGVIIKNFDVHDEYIDNLTLLGTDIDSKPIGFAAAGGSSMVCLYRDVTESHILALKEEQETDLQHQQELNNYLFNEEYMRALRLSIKLKKPMATYKILTKIQEMETECVEPLSPIEITKKTEVGKAVSQLENDNLKELFLFAVKWNTNAKTFLVGQKVIAIILCSVPNSELVLWSDFAKHVEALHAYSDRYYRRLKEDADRLAFFDYLKDVVHTYKNKDVAMDTS